MARRKQQSSRIGRMVADIAFARAAGGSGIWLGVGILTTAGHIVRRLGRRRKVIWRAKLSPGTAVAIDHLLRDRASGAVVVRRGGRITRARG